MNNRIFYHSRKPNKVNEFTICEHCGKDTRVNKGLNPPIFTVGFQYDSENKILFIAWSKPTNGENYIKSFGIDTINNRLDRMIKMYPNLSYEKNMPKVVKNYINFYIDKARKYFKEMPNNDSVMYFI